MSSTGGSLCSDCQNENWNSLIERPLSSNFTQIQPHNSFDDRHLHGRFVRTLKSRADPRCLNCPCCRFLYTINHGIEEFNSENLTLPMNVERYLHRLEVTTLGSQMQLKPHRSDLANLALLRLSIQDKEVEQAYWQGRRHTALLGPGRNSKFLRIPHLIMDNFAWIRNAISHCHCSQSYAKSDSGGSQILDGLVLIDCIASTSARSMSAKSIITCSAPASSQYATLSYVWGPEGCVRDGDVPLVVKDAMNVTLQLKLQYLWVDRYCIPQRDKKKKQQQIQNMNEVFSKSYITIVAAAGKTAAYGLSGVGAARIPQKEIQVNGYTLLELPSIIDTVKNSTWALRAWTLQEGLLSKRSLAFTDRGVLYHCRDLHIEEPLQRLVPNDMTVAMDNFESNDGWDIQRLFATRESGTSDGIVPLRQRIVQYTQRQLSFPEDSLNAFLGVFTDFEQNKKAKPPVSASQDKPSGFGFPSHIWGVPFDYRVDVGIPLLEWYHPLPAIRRDKFPSWSWTGWEGAIQFTKYLLTPRFTSMVPECQPVSYNLPPDNLEKTTVLHVTGPLVPLKFASQKDIKKVSKEKPTKSDVKALPRHSVFELSPGTFAIIRSYMDTVLGSDAKTFGLLLFHTPVVIPYSTSRKMKHLEGIIILKENFVQKGAIRSFSRVGFLYSEDLWKCEYVNIKGASVDKKVFPQCGSQAFGQQIERHRICLQ